MRLYAAERLGLTAGIALAAGWSWIAARTVVAATNPWTPAAGFVVKAWDAEAGLPQNTVNVVLQTRDGYLWLGTQAGLARFDGVRFTTYDRQNSSLQQDHILALCASKDGSLWIGTGDYGGLYHWRADGRIVNGLPGFHVRALLVEHGAV